MGWREWLGERFDLWDAGGCASWDDWMVTVDDMPPADRIAMARELLAGTGRAPMIQSPLRDDEMLIHVEMRTGDRRCDYSRIVPMVMAANFPGDVVGAEATDVALRVMNAARDAMTKDPTP